jgi:dienelactone hydrolase
MPLRPASALLFTLVLGLNVPLPAWSDQAVAPVAPDLQALVRNYVEAPDAEKADQLLEKILGREDATIATVGAALAAGHSYGIQPVGTQPSQEVRVGARAFSYGLYVPSSYRPDQSYGLVICLHGAGFTGDSYLERWQTRLGETYILACPTLMAGNWWTRTGEDLVLATIRAVSSRYRIDPDRVFLTGMSNGGIGAYLIGAHHAARFAAIMPMAAGLDDVLMPFLENFRQTPLYIIHGRQDEVMPVGLSRSIVKELDRLGYAYLYREHDRVHPMAGGHFFPREELPALVAWLALQRRNPNPTKLTFSQDASHLLPFGWARIDATDRIAEFSENLTDRRDAAVKNREYAKVEVEIAGRNRIEVRTQRVRRYTLYLNETLVDLARPVTVVTNGARSFEGMIAVSLRTLLREARLRQDPRTLYPAKVTIDVAGPK